MPFLPPAAVTGVYFRGLNAEQVLGLQPDVIITMKGDPMADALQQKLGIPVVAVAKDPTSAYADSIRIIGKIVGNEADAGKMADFWEQTTKAVADEAAKVPADKRLSVLYTGRTNSILQVPGKNTVFGSSIDTAGGKNVGDELADAANETIPVSIEQILKWNPDIILASSIEAKNKIMADPGYQALAAVKNGKVFVQPQYGGLDGIQAIMGMIWIQDVLLHGNDAASQAAFAAKMKAYHTLFFNRTITDAEIAALNPTG